MGEIQYWYCFPDAPSHMMVWSVTITPREVRDVGSKAFSSTPKLSPLHSFLFFINAQRKEYEIEDFPDHPHPHPPPSEGEGNKEGHAAVGA